MIILTVPVVIPVPVEIDSDAAEGRVGDHAVLAPQTLLHREIHTVK